MQLTRLKIVGFKSFVDATNISLTSPLTAIVGPNGCGKSNVIDAIKWVLGENASKSLRTESATDVIFNGSLTRKPLGQAFVEITFNNHLKPFQGAMGALAEVMVKRLVTRDGDNQYFLNSVRCRKRDIQDLFSGTGVGSQGYAIIGQEMISKIIESKPIELKSYLDEAAGISQYKTRRHEAYLRIQSTEQNLTRINDISCDQAKRLDKLAIQAENANIFKRLKKNQRDIQSAINHLECQSVQKALLENRETTTKYIKSHDLMLGERNKNEEQLNLLIKDFKALKSASETITLKYHEADKALIRAEEEWLHVQNLQKDYDARHRTNADNYHIHCQKKQILDADIQKAHEEAVQARERLTLSQTQIERLKAEKKEAQLTFDTCHKSWVDAQKNQHNLMHRIEKNELSKTHALDNLETLKNQMTSLYTDIQNKETECDVINLKDLEKNRADIEEKINQTSDAYADVKQRLNHITNALNGTKLDLKYAFEALMKTKTELASKKASRLAFIQVKEDENTSFMTNKFSMLHEYLTVEDEWQALVAWVLEDKLHAYISDDMAHALDVLSQPKLSKWMLIKPLPTSTVSVAPKHKLKMPLLTDKCQMKKIGDIFEFGSIYCAEDMKMALKWQEKLQKGESILSLDGYWMTQNSIRFKRFSYQSEDNVFALNTAIDALILNQRVHEKTIKRKESHIKRWQALEQIYQKRAQDLLDGITQLKISHQSCAYDIKTKHALKEKLLLEMKQNQNELNQCAQAHNDMLEKVSSLKAEAAVFKKQIVFEAAQSKALEASYNKASSQLALKQSLLTDEEALCHQKELTHQQAINTIKNLHDKQQTIDESIAHIKREARALKHAYKTLSESNQKSCADKPKTLKKIKDEYENQMNDLVALMSEKKSEILQFEKNIASIALKLEKQRNLIQHYDVQHEKLHLKLHTFDEKALEVTSDVKHILDNVGKSVYDLQIKLQKVETSIENLGLVNLVAIDEYDEEMKEKHALDAQMNDLESSIDLLKCAIKEMDDETKNRLKDAFFELNKAFSDIFPQLFHGGRAKLTLTCDNILEAGIIILAEPPGKKISRLQLLSGGEKALTALALLFAHFQLNPAPFCLLDEVDAPLDDANVGKLCDLLKRMSVATQFLFVTHSKQTMTIANDLIGITMSEQGVSRVVSVNINQALTMAE